MATRPASDASPPGGSNFNDLTQKYARYLRGQRGLSENTLRIYLTDVESFRQYLAQERRDPSQMDRQLLRGYLAWLATSARDGREGYARVSITRKLTALRSFYRFLVQEEWFRSSPVPNGRSFQVKVEKPLPAFLGQQEAARLLETPDTSEVLGRRDRAILEVLYSCGVRLAEIHGMDLPDIKFASREILVRGKGSRERWVLFGKPTEDALRSYLSDSRPMLAAVATPALFLNRYGQRLSRRSFQKLVRQYAARAGLRNGVHPHTLRHTFASHMLEGHADLRVIQELLGHSSPTTTQHYTHITRVEARNAYLNYHPRASG
ncbi:MAG TPA: tyrosine-type recombinase/integrase [Dehalococcoidia bacterium]|nr:tyrosine-type recombinase/integrase [Dehalococcoidia bacterium]